MKQLVRYVRPDFRIFVSLLAIAAIGGLAGPLGKYALREIPAFGYAFIRLLASTAIMFTVLRYQGVRLTWKKFRLFAPVATFWWLNALIFTIGLQKTNATTAQFIHVFIPVLTALLAALVIRERLNARQWLGSFVAICGVVVVVTSKGTLSFHNAAVIGNLLIFVSAFAFAAYAVFSKNKKYQKLTPVEMVCVASICGAVASAVPAAIEYSSNPWLMNVPAVSLLAMLGGVTTISLFYICFQLLLKKYGPSIATTNLYVLPVFVVFWAYLILGEAATNMVGVGGTVAIVGVLIFSYGSRKKSAHPATQNI
jgi:drug/metabolite transporter (DMT)-like permease